MLKDCDFHVINKSRFHFCDACQFGMSHALPIQLCFADDFSRFRRSVGVYPLSVKPDALAAFSLFKITNLTGKLKFYKVIGEENFMCSQKCRMNVGVFYLFRH